MPEDEYMREKSALELLYLGSAYTKIPILRKKDQFLYSILFSK